jgi:hypothetical protein
MYICGIGKRGFDTSRDASSRNFISRFTRVSALRRASRPCRHLPLICTAQTSRTDLTCRHKHEHITESQVTVNK